MEPFLKLDFLVAAKKQNNLLDQFSYLFNDAIHSESSFQCIHEEIFDHHQKINK